MAAEPADDWAPVGQPQKAPDDDWQPTGGAQPAEGDSFDQRFAGEEPIPESFLKRLVAGRNMDVQIKRTRQDFDALKEGFGSEPLGWSNEHVKELIDMGVLSDPARGNPGPLRLLQDSLVYGVPQVLDAAMRGVNAGLHFGASVASHVAEDLPGGSENDAQRLKRELTNFGNYLMVDGMAKFGRSHPSGEQVVGTLPREADFKNAAEVIAPSKFRDVPDSILKENVSKWTSGAAGGANVEMLGEAVNRFGVPVGEQTVLYRGEWPGRPQFGAEKTAISVSDRAAADSFALSRNESALESAGEPKASPIPISEIVIPPGTKVLDASKFAGENAGELEQMLPPGHYELMATRREPFKVGSATIEQEIKTYRFEPDRTPETNLREAWQEKGIHPAEAAHDAQTDSFLRHDLSSAAAEPGLPPVTPITPAEPAPLAGRIAAAVKETTDTALDIGRDMQMLLTPMATGTTESMAIAKDFANTMRRNRWEWSRIDADIEKRFTPEQRKRMWDAADEESVMRQEGKTSEHMGLATLEPAERAAIEDLQTRAQNAWVRARDLGMVEGEGLPAYTPRMVINAGEALSGEGAIALNGLGLNLKTRTGQMKHRAYLTAEQTEAAMKAKFGEEAGIARDIRTLPLATAKLEDAIAGRTLIENIKDYGKRTADETVAEGGIPAGSEHKWFTMDHPAFKTWRPKYKEVDGKVEAVKDAEGNVIFEQAPIYIRDDFEGPLKAVLTQRSGPLYQSMMALKGKTMGLIMNSPAIHNMVELGRAFPAMPTRIFKAYFDGNRAKNDPMIMREAIDAGLVPIGKRFFNQDVTSIMEAPDLTPGRSWTAKIAAAVPGLFDEAAGVAVKRAIDKAGDFWHNTLLWDRIADLQMGLYTNLRGDLLRKGVDQQTASRMAAHFANRYAGALPKEAMSDGAAKAANFFMFSRSFTLGNLGVMKDMFTGLPKDVLAQITRDMGVVDPAAVGYAKSLARRKAIAAVVLDIGLLYVGNSVLQSALNVMLGDNTIDEEVHGYAKRAKEVLNDVRAHPIEMLQPFDLVERLSATSENEPGKKDRLKIGYSKDGTAIYARNPVGKIGEEFIGYAFSPIDMLKKKQGTIARPMLQVINNDKGFGRKIYDPTADTPAKYAGNIWAIVEHIAKAQTPEGQINALADVVKGDGDPKVNLMQGLGPVAGVTFSKGAPGGPAVGEMYHERSQYQFRVDMAMPDIRKQIARGDIDGAQRAMTALGIQPGLQRFYIRTSLNPATRLSPKALRDFYSRATPEQRERMERIRSPQEGSPLSP